MSPEAGAGGRRQSDQPRAAIINTDATVHLRRVERLAKSLLAMKFEGAQGFWQFQLDLLAVQRDIQAAIREAKKEPPGAERVTTLTGLRWARWHAKTLGDALAWLLLGLDRQVIHSLGRNSRVGVHASRHGDQGALAIAQYLANEGQGFPLIHDVTDCLRIGDVTFIQPPPDGENAKSKLHTVEVKTRLISERPTDEGKTEYGYEVQITGYASSPDDFPIRVPVGAPLESPEQLVPPVAPRPPDARHQRQLRRMGNALMRQEASPREVVELQGEPPLLTVRFDSSAASYWPHVRRVIRNARQTGLATEMPEPGLLVVAIYDRDGVRASTLEDLLSPDLHQEQMFPGGMRDENAALVHAVPARDPDRMNMFLPYYLYSIPNRAIVDILRGRLIIAVIVNPAFIFKALEADGFEILKRGGHPASAVVSAQITLDDGSIYRFEWPNLSRYLNEIVYEFKGFEYVVETARAIRNNAVIAIKHRSEMLAKRSPTA